MPCVYRGHTHWYSYYAITNNDMYAYEETNICKQVENQFYNPVEQEYTVAVCACVVCIPSLSHFVRYVLMDECWCAVKSTTHTIIRTHQYLCSIRVCVLYTECICVQAYHCQGSTGGSHFNIHPILISR